MFHIFFTSLFNLFCKDFDKFLVWILEYSQGRRNGLQFPTEDHCSDYCSSVFSWTNWMLSRFLKPSLPWLGFSRILILTPPQNFPPRTKKYKNDKICWEIQKNLHLQKLWKRMFSLMCHFWWIVAQGLHQKDSYSFFCCHCFPSVLFSFLSSYWILNFACLTSFYLDLRSTYFDFWKKKKNITQFSIRFLNEANVYRNPDSPLIKINCLNAIVVFLLTIIQPNQIYSIF